MKFAMMEMKSTMSNIIRKYKLLPADPVVELKPAVEVVLGSITGFSISLEKRRVSKD